MIIEFELQGSKCLHKGIMETTGFWCRYEEEGEYGDATGPDDKPMRIIDGYKIYSHLSFAFYHTDKTMVDLVYSRLISVLRGANNVDIEGIGYIRRLNK